MIPSLVSCMLSARTLPWNHIGHGLKILLMIHPQYEKLVKAMKTLKSFGPKYKFGIEVPRLTTFGQKQFKSTHNVLARPLPNAVFHHLIEPFLFRNPGEQRWPMLLSEVQDSQIKGEKALPSLQGGMDAPCKS